MKLYKTNDGAPRFARSCSDKQTKSLGFSDSIDDSAPGRMAPAWSTLTVCDIENGPVEIVYFPTKNGDFP